MASKPPEGPRAGIDDLETWISAYEEAKRNRQAWEEIESRAKEVITKRLDEAKASVGTVAGRPRIHWRPITQTRFNAKRFRRENETLAEKYLETSERWNFDVL